jgi:hypothetical protein
MNGRASALALHHAAEELVRWRTSCVRSRREIMDEAGQLCGITESRVRTGYIDRSSPGSTLADEETSCHRVHLVLGPMVCGIRPRVSWTYARLAVVRCWDRRSGVHRVAAHTAPIRRSLASGAVGLALGLCWRSSAPSIPPGRYHPREASQARYHRRPWPASSDSRIRPAAPC